MKLCVLGGGGFRTPFVWQALLRDPGSPRVTEVVLQDADPLRLQGISRVLGAMAAGFDDPPVLRTTTDLDTALEGADFVFAAVRIGGLRGRVLDERVALDLGVLGQETTGPGGLSYALRTLPFMLDVAARMRRLAPTAWLLNFTNPAGIVTQGVQQVLGDRVVGICDTPADLGRRVVALLGADPATTRLDYAGLNHLGWLNRVLVDGVDVLPGLLADADRLADLEEAQVFGARWLAELGSVPNEYLYYYYRRREALQRIAAAAATRGEQLQRTQGDFFTGLADTAPDEALRRWRRTVDERNAGYMADARGGPHTTGHDGPPETDPAQQGYAGVALAVMAALARDEPASLVLDVRNAGAVAAVPDDAVVEIPVVVDAAGVHRQPVSPLDLHQSGLVQQLKAVELGVVAAVRDRDPVQALRAFALHPLVDSVDVARDLLAGYRRAFPETDALLGPAC